MAVINFIVVSSSAELLNSVSSEIHSPGRRALHAAHAVKLADVILAREQSRAYRGKARNGQRRSRDVLHCSKPFSDFGRGLSRPDRDL